MAEFLTTHQTAASIESIIMNAKEHLVLVSPFLQISGTFLDRLKDADGRGVKIIIVYGKDELKDTERAQLNKLKNLTLHYCHILHAKCYFNQDTMVITSMNMYEFSEKNNREMGVLIKKDTDKDVYQAAARETQSIINSVKEHDTHKVKTSSKSKASTSDKPTQNKTLIKAISTVISSMKNDAYCIRCGERIPFDMFRPLCDDCYDEWSDYGNPYHSEKFCHECGKKTKTSKDRPVCKTCYFN
ncbi:phospholipase D-like domain-containing protein [Chloroflexota bacterium]